MVKWILFGVIVPMIDMVTDIVTAGSHFYFDDYAWGSLTLIFVWLPGFVVALAISIRGLMDKVSIQRVINYSIFLVGFPILYPIIQVLV